MASRWTSDSDRSAVRISSRSRRPATVPVAFGIDAGLVERVLNREVALHHYAYFPGTVITAAAWRLLPSPFDDYRLFILLCTVASFFAALAFRAPLGWRLALGAVILANPIAVRSAWFGQNDAPTILLLVLAFALVTRRRWGWAAASLAGAVLLKQFAIVGVPFFGADEPLEQSRRHEGRRHAVTLDEVQGPIGFERGLDDAGRAER